MMAFIRCMRSGTHGQEEAWKGFVEVEGDNHRPKPHSRCQVSPGQLDQADAAWNEGMRFSRGYPPKLHPGLCFFEDVYQ